MADQTYDAARDAIERGSENPTLYRAVDDSPSPIPNVTITKAGMSWGVLLAVVGLILFSKRK